MEERAAFHYQQMQVRCRQLQNQVTSLNAKLRSAEEQISELRKSHAEKDEEMNELKEQLQRERERVQKMAAKLASIRTKETIETHPARPTTAENYEACSVRSSLKAVSIRPNNKSILRTKVATPREDPSLLNLVSIAGKKITSVGKHELNGKCPLDKFSDGLTTTSKNSELVISGLIAHPGLHGHREIPNIIFALHNRLRKCQEDIETAMKIQFAFDDILAQLQVEATQCAELVDGKIKEAFFKRISKFFKMVELLGSETNRMKRFFTAQKVEGMSTLENIDMKMIDFQNSDRTKIGPNQEINGAVDSFHMNLDIQKFQDVVQGTVQENNSLMLQLKSGDQQATWNLSPLERELDVCQGSDLDDLEETSGSGKSAESTNDNVLTVQGGDKNTIEEGIIKFWSF